MAVDAQTEAGERLRRVIRHAQGERGSLRTHLDEWAAYEYGGLLLSRSGRQIWLNNPCPWVHWRRLAKHMDWHTPEAAQILWRGMERDPAVRKPKGGQPAPYRIIVEHAVPVKIIGEAVRDDTSLWRPDRLHQFLRHHLKRGVLTSGEDGRLNAAGLRQAMPRDWRPGADPFARYKQVGIGCAHIVGL